jgi:methyltransferase (TIGR00027 family)
MLSDRASRTAEGVAARRAVHQLLDTPAVFTDPLAIRLLHPKIAASLRERLRTRERSSVARYLRAFLAARSRLAEDHVDAAVQRGVSQYVILGAGFDTFAYRNPHSNLHVYDVDHPATQVVKRRRLAAVQIAIPASVSYVSADLGEVPLAEALASSTFDSSRPAVFAWLGVVPYLELASIKAVLAYVATLPVGTEIIFDYGVPPRSLNFVARFFYRRIAKRVEAAGEPWKSFFTPQEMCDVLRECDFSIIHDFGAKEINARYFTNRSDRLRVGSAGRIVTAVVGTFASPTA